MMYGFLILILMISPELRAGDNILTLDEAVAQVLSLNPDVQAAHLRTEAARARVPLAKALEDPQAGVTFDNVPRNTWDIQQGDAINYRLEQKIPFPGKRYVRGKAARFDAQATAEEMRGTTQDVVLDLKRTYFDLYRIERTLEANKDNQQLLKQLLGSAEASYAAGQTNADRPLKIRVELTRLENEGILLDQERTTHQSHLKALLNQPVHATHPETHQDIRLPNHLTFPPFTAKLEDVIQMTLESRSELKVLDAGVARDRAKLTGAKQALLPDFSFGVEYNQRSNREDAWTGSAMMSLPIFLPGKRKAEISEAHSLLKATEAERESMRVHTRHDIEQAYSAVQAAKKLVDAYQINAVPQAKASFEAARLAYSSGQSDLLTLIDAARMVRELTISLYEGEARLGTAFAELERLVGKEFTKRSSS